MARTKKVLIKKFMYSTSVWILIKKGQKFNVHKTNLSLSL